MLQKWSSYSLKLKQYYSEKVKGRHYNTRWSEDVEDFLLLLKLLPSKQAGKSAAATVANFNKASEMFITFELVSIETNNLVMKEPHKLCNLFDFFQLEIHTTSRNGEKVKKLSNNHCLWRVTGENRVLLLES